MPAKRENINRRRAEQRGGHEGTDLRSENFSSWNTWRLSVASVNDVEQLRQKLGVTASPQVMRSISIAVDYFQRVLHVNPLEPAHLNYVRGIDFHRSVSVEQKAPGQLLVRFPEIAGGVIQPERQKAYRFFALPGATPLHLGWNPDEMGFQLFQLRQPVSALISSASAIRFGDGRSRLGGDIQIVVPWNTNIALLRHRDFDRQKMAQMLRAGYLPLGLE